MSILPDNVDRYRKFFAFIIKYWKSNLADYSSTRALGETDITETEDFGQKPDELAEDLINMGPAYIKLGQLLSTRPDLLPRPYLVALSELQDDVEPIAFDEVQKVFEEEIKVTVSKAFMEFEQEPVASASLGQVHMATLHSGIKVAVKIQRPGIQSQFLADLDTIQQIADWAVEHSQEAQKYNVSEIVEELRFTLLQELDYSREAQNLITLKENLKEFDRLYVPKPFPGFSSKKVLTMEFVEGKKVTKVTALKRIEDDLDPLVVDLIEAYLKQIIIDGFAHADPHPGNVHIMPDNRLALMDLGMTTRFTKESQENILRLMIGLSNYDSGQICKTLLSISDYDKSEADIATFKKRITRLVQDNQNKNAEDMQTGRLIIQMNQAAAQNYIKIPVELNMLAKILLNLDQIVAVLSPKFKASDIISRYVHKLMKRKMVDELEPANLFQTLLQSKELVEKMPERLNKVLELISENELRIQVDAIDQKRFTGAFQKVANRITAGIVIAAMIIGAALLIQIPTTWTVFGYPGLAITLFFIAAILGFYLIYTIIVTDDSLSK